MRAWVESAGPGFASLGAEPAFCCRVVQWGRWTPPPHVHARGNLSWLLLTDVMLWSGWGGGPQWCPPGLLREQKRASTLVTRVIRNLEGRSFGVLGGPKWDQRDLPGQRTQPDATLWTFYPLEAGTGPAPSPNPRTFAVDGKNCDPLPHLRQPWREEPR